MSFTEYSDLVENALILIPRIYARMTWHSCTGSGNGFIDKIQTIEFVQTIYDWICDKPKAIAYDSMFIINY